MGEYQLYINIADGLEYEAYQYAGEEGVHRIDGAVIYLTPTCFLVRRQIEGNGYIYDAYSQDEFYSLFDLAE